MEGLVIRVAFNNRDWKGKCYKPLSDPRCYKCRSGHLYINKGYPIEEDENGFCKGDFSVPLSNFFNKNEKIWCWEQMLCRYYFWGNPVGKWNVVKGMKVFFVYQEPDRRYTLWGHSVVKEIHNEIPVNKQGNEYPYLIFEPFEALPEDKRIRGLTPEELVGTSKWNMPFYRYIDTVRVNSFLSLIRGEQIESPLSLTRGDVISSPSKKLPLYKEKKPLKIWVSGNIFHQLNEIAITEGRDIEEVVREAIAKLIRERGRKNMPFEDELRERIAEARRRCNSHIGTRLLQMMTEYGSVEAVRMLLRQDRVQTGLMQLWECGCLNLSVEDLILKFPDLFTAEELDIARRRLQELGYF